MSDLSTLDHVRAYARILHADEHYTEVLRHIGNASLVLLGEATHGTREFYQARAEISKRLITEQGFDAIAVEADWPDALRVSRYVQHVSHEKTADEALGGFERFPRWMWRNAEVLDLIYWLRLHNLGIGSPTHRIGFFGLDVYSLHKSIAEVLRYLDALDPDAARHARERYGCFDHLAEHPQRYGYATVLGLRPDCEEAVVRQLTALHAQAGEFLLHGGAQAADELFYAQQNARVAKNAEAYYRAMFCGRDTSWNVRDDHMAETLQALRAHLSERTGHPAKIIVWAHNSHIGDARADSIEGLFHKTGLGNFFLPLRDADHDEFPAVLSAPYQERAIGVVYLPHSEAVSHYFEADVTQQFDALIHFDRTHAVKPLDHSPAWVHDEVPDTYPFGV